MEEEPIPKVVRDSVTGASLGAATANVIMQLSRLPVGHGVAESRVDSGRLDLHPLKRLRTTLAYVAVAMLGTARERETMRRAVNGQHRHVRSGEGDPVKYNAFDPELQLWVAACLYKGTADVYALLHGEPDEEAADILYRHAARFATTLQVKQDMWPVDRAAFDVYWNAELARIETDPTTRRYLLNLADLTHLPGPLRWSLGRLHRFLATGFLPAEFRDELGLEWSPRHQRAFDAYAATIRALHRVTPRPLRAFPFNACLWDLRRRMRTGRTLV